MKFLCIYGSTNGRTRIVAQRLLKSVDIKIDAVDIKGISLQVFKTYSHIIWLVPTYGDEELQEDIEKFIITQKNHLHKFHYSVCECGNYSGYDAFNFGPHQILRSYFANLGCAEFYDGVSIDCLPKVDWETFDRWCKGLNAVIGDGKNERP